MKVKIPNFAKRHLSFSIIVGVTLLLGVGLGIGVGHWVKHHRTSPSVEAHSATPNVADDRNGPAEVLPPPPPAAAALPSEPAPEPAPIPETPPPPSPVAPAPQKASPPESARSSTKPAWLKYAVAAKPSAGRPQISIVIDDLGLDKRRTKRAIELPAPLTLAFMTYADDLPSQTEMAHDHGHELLVHMPMQALSSHFNAGPNVLEVGMSADELHHRIQWGLERFTGFVGVNNHMGSRFTGNLDGMQVVMQELKQRGLMFLDSVTTDVSAAGDAAKRVGGVPFVQRQVFLDNEQSLDSIREQLAKTEAIARSHGHAIAIGHPHDATLTALADWLPTLEAKGFSVVPVTTLVKEQAK